MVLLSDIWNNFWSLFPFEVQQAYYRNTGPFLLITAVLVLAFLVLPCLFWPRKGTTIAGKHRVVGGVRWAGLLALALVMALISPFASSLLLRLLGR
jgi:hypothetical protein